MIADHFSISEVYQTSTENKRTIKFRGLCRGKHGGGEVKALLFIGGECASLKLLAYYTFYS